MHRQPSNLRALRAAWRAAADAVTERSTPCFRVVNEAKATKLYVYDVIGGWDNDAAEFVQAVHGLDVDAFDLHINSPGGFVFDAVAMYEAVAEHSARVTVKVDGLAASAASFLAMAGDDIEIAKGGRMMIHDAQGVGIGSPAELREYADLLDEVSNDIAGYYAGRAGGKPAAWRTAMSATTWYSAQQAVDAKLADRVAGGKTKTEGPDNRTRLIQARHRALTA
ncbi:head maturation protease, ClpP-related [Micromonospora zamorensis]|uniref:head maturation protease, ClpP-related n=1 Tax=Micromonospora zamorensis TaxID=709883 RepID=UPI00081FFD11|nr:head maturation protease, ClpP-related [Micromonospora zamorensis]SCG38206.1 ATP-dependent protease ClpP, protease subunit [Micromonospora zamorensis]